jgi:hypothetical protein
MIDFRRIVYFWFKLLGFHGAVLALIFLLAVLNEFLTKSAPIVSFRFWLAVGVDMLPAIFVVIIVMSLTSRFLQRACGLDTRWEAFQFLIRNRFGNRGLAPFLKIDQGRIPTGSSTLLTEVGGKGSLIISNNSAVVLQRFGKLTRVSGPGYIKLEPFEKLYDTLDLRPKHQKWAVRAMTQEGIPITWELEIRYRLQYGRRKSNEKYPNPFLKDSIFKAATCKQVCREDGMVITKDWEELVLFEAESVLRSIVTKFRLDQLVDCGGTQPQEVREAILQYLNNALPKQVAGCGAIILSIQLHNFQVDDDVTQHWIREWQARLHQINAIKLTLENGGQAPLEEMLKAETMKLPLKTLYQELEKQNPDQAVILMVLTHFLSGITDPIDSKFSAQMLSILDRLQDPPKQNSDKTTPQLNLDSLKQAKDRATPVSVKTTNDENGGTGDLHPTTRRSAENFPMELNERKLARQRMVSRVLPIISEIAAGSEKPNFDDAIGYLQQTEELRFELLGESNQQALTARMLRGKQLRFIEEYNYFVTKVSGESMDQAGIEPEDYVILRKPKQVPLLPENGDIVAVVLRDDVDRKATLKRIFIERGANNRPKTIRLQPESSNSEYNPRSLSPMAFAGNDPLVAVVGIAEAVLKPYVGTDHLPRMN